jgi:hypothetical protein
MVAQSRRLAFVFGQGFLDPAENSRGRSAFPFEEPQLIPQPDDFPFLVGVHRAYPGDSPPQ